MLEITVAIDGTALPMRDREDLARFHNFLGVYLSIVPSAAAPSVPTPPAPPASRRERVATTPAASKARAGKAKPAAGAAERGTGKLQDILARVLEHAAAPMKMNEIVDRLQAAGWNTKSSNPSRIVQQTLYGNRNLFERTGRGTWTLADGYRPYREVVEASA